VSKGGKFVKKFLGAIIIMTLLVILCIPVSAVQTVSYNMPKAYEAPKIDGIIDPEEWANALVIEFKPRDPNIWLCIGDINDFEGATFYLMWADEGIYFAASVTDTSAPANVPVYGNGSYNGGDAIQFNIFAARDISGAGLGDTLFFSCHPKTDTGQAAVGEHFVYGDGGSGKDVPGAIVDSVMNGNSYTIEGLLPRTAFGDLNNFPIIIQSGTKFYMNCIVMYQDDATQGLVGDNEYFDGAVANEYVLVDTIAGKVPPPVVEEVEEAVTLPAEIAPTPRVPQTSNMLAGAIILVLGSAGVITYVSKKKR